MTKTGTNENAPDLMKFGEAVDYLGLSKYKFRKLREAGLIKPVEGIQHPDHALYRKTDLQRFIG